MGLDLCRLTGVKSERFAALSRRGKVFGVYLAYAAEHAFVSEERVLVLICYFFTLDFCDLESLLPFEQLCGRDLFAVELGLVSDV